MDSSNLILTEPVRPPALLEQLDTSKLNGASDEEKKKIAKDFESILLNRVLGEMQNTIGDWGFEKDGPFKQVRGIFYMFLSREIANSGGMGMWKNIYEFLTSADQTHTMEKTLDTDI